MFLIRPGEKNQSEQLKICSKYLKTGRQENLTDLLNDGHQLVFVDYNDIDLDLISLPQERLGLEVKVPMNELDFKRLATLFSSFIIYCAELEQVRKIALLYPSAKFYIGDAEKNDYKQLLEQGFNLILDEFHLSDIGFFTSLFMANATTDRPDNLFPTVVVDEHGIALGLCYSSIESIQEAITTKTGVYHSRKRGLWRKGETSGATQELLNIDLDCDRDTLCFKVFRYTTVPKGLIGAFQFAINYQTHELATLAIVHVQTNVQVRQKNGFCHLQTKTCFGNSSGLASLFETLEDRLIQNLPNSYSKRLFQDEDLLNAKIKEEADEVCQAVGKRHLTEELGDLIYFTFVKAVAAGVSMSDIEDCLDKRALKVIRREGNAKPAYLLKSNTEKCETGKDRKLPNDCHEMAIVGDSQTNPEAEFKLRVYNNSQLSLESRQMLLQRPIQDTVHIMDRVRPIMKQVRERGDKALIEYGFKFDGVTLDQVVLKAPFSPNDMCISADVKKSIDLAYENILKFHQAQLDTSDLVVETMPGVICTRFMRPIQKVGLYIPGGTAILPSTALMLGIPAKVAGCEEIVFITPPKRDGSIAAEIVYVAEKIGASMIVMAGGAQGVAAVAYGTESVPKVDKICGPGNQYVTCAKMIAQSDTSALVAIDMPAGPSELLVICDSNANKAYVVSDLLSQAEHGPDSQVVLVTVGMNSEEIDELQGELARQAEVLPRSEIVKVAISKSYILAINSIEEALDFSNKYAPEHLILNVNGAEELVSRIFNAGSVFVGAYSPESCGDYASGTNHTLPTYGYARMYSGVNTHTFLKHITSQRLTRDGLNTIGDAVTTLASIEGLEAHRNAVAIRLKDMRK